MITDYRPQSEISDAEFREVMLPRGREPASLTDIQYMYGQLLDLGVESPAPDEYSKFLTPMEASAVVGQEQGIVYLDVQLNRDEQSIRPLGATVVTGTEEHIYRCALSHYDAAKGVDHSITQKTSKKSGIDPEKSTYKDFSYITENKLSTVVDGWPTQDLIQPVIENHDDGWIIQEINALSASDEMERVRDEIEDTLTVDGTKDITRLVSVRFFESDSTEPVDELDLPDSADAEGWLYPADVEVLLEAMKAQRTGKWRTKNKSDASGTAAGYVHSDTVDDVYGMGEAPLSLYTGKKRAWMPNLNRDLSAATHPFKAETLGMIGKSKPLLDVCTQSAGLSIYHLPYFAGEQTPQKMRYLYELLWETYIRRQQEDEDDESIPSHTPIERFYKQLVEKAATDGSDSHESVIDSFRFWTVNIINYQSDRKRAIAEIKGTNALRTVDVAKQAESVARDLSNTSLFETYSWDFANPETDFHAQITTPYYFISTTVTTTDEDDVDANEPGYALFQQLLRDQPLSLSQLLEAYIPHIESSYDAAADDGKRVPTLQIIQQFAQLATLSRSGLLDVDIPEVADTNEPYRIPVDGDSETTDSDTDMTETTDDTNPDHDDSEEDSTKTSAKERAIAEQEAYKRMITEQPVLSESPSRRAVFTLGSLITTVSGYQASKGTKPLNSRLNPTTITKHNIQQYVTDVLEQINTYAGAEGGNNIWKYETQTGQLTEDLTAKPVSEWELSSADIQYHLALGMAFGAQRHD